MIGLAARRWLVDKLAADDSQLDKLDRFAAAVVDANRRQNLIARDTEPVLGMRHVVDSAQLLLLARQHGDDGGLWIDLGSGAGFPGIPIKLGAPELHVTLIESQNKKATFLREVIRTLGSSS